ncbi:hypothetical protein F5Y18DRAFT_386163 [Xylariaceae sp. FL1019]|nr:hypothetical protein F5Y18DRAFT_386163 [Xylariaceae sp. FL1019]
MPSPTGTVILPLPVAQTFALHCTDCAVVVVCFDSALYLERQVSCLRSICAKTWLLCSSMQHLEKRTSKLSVSRSQRLYDCVRTRNILLFVIVANAHQVLKCDHEL